MKKKIQFFLFLFIIIISFVFYNTYIKSPDTKEISNLNEKDKITSVTKNNVIKNLKYDVKFDDNSKYSIFSKFSEIVNQKDKEIVYMNNVIAKFNDGKNPTIQQQK